MRAPNCTGPEATETQARRPQLGLCLQLPRQKGQHGKGWNQISLGGQGNTPPSRLRICPFSSQRTLMYMNDALVLTQIHD